MKLNLPSDSWKLFVTPLKKYTHTPKNKNAKKTKNPDIQHRISVTLVGKYSRCVAIMKMLFLFLKHIIAT